MRPLRLRTGLLLALLLPALLLTVVGGLGAYREAREVLVEELRRSLAAQAAVAASLLNGERLLQVLPGDDATEGRRVWRNLLSDLEAVRAASGARRVVTVDTLGVVRADTGRRGRGGEREGGEPLPVGAEMPELLQDTTELAEVWAGRASASQVLFEGLDGQLYLRGYAPVRSGRSGEVVGALVLEGSAAFFGPLGQLALRAAWVWAAALAVLAAGALAAAAALARPLRRLMEGALRIGGGDLATPVPATGGALLEVAVLARELEAMRQALEGRDRQLKMMIAGVAHEVRNPLGGIELFGGLLAEELGGGTPEARSHLARIQAEVAYLKRIVEEFLVYARERRLHLAPLAAEAWVSEAAVHLEGEARARGVPLQVEAEPAPLAADAPMLTAALVNLVKNALQASPPGAPVRVRGRRSGAAYAVEVEDAGPGIPAEAQARIWEPFFTTREKGTGLGLPLARKLVEAHGGTLSLASAPGRTLFRIELPVASGKGEGREAA
jgi:signal transduction histidine kinase